MLPAWTYAQSSLWPKIQAGFTIHFSVHNPRIKHYIRYYQTHPQRFHLIMQRGVPYLYQIYSAVRERKMPTEIVLLPFIESGFNPQALSSAGALGIWQLMPMTAQRFSIDPDHIWFDGRKDIDSSTDSALTYLDKLYHLFDHNWLLALGAYNSGEGTVQRAITYNIKKGKSAGFWSLGLPRQTRNYVPKLLAVVAIVKRPGHYGLALPPVIYGATLKKYLLTKQITLKNIARFSGLSLSEVQQYNPGFIQAATPPNGHYTLYLPPKNMAKFQAAYDRYLKYNPGHWQSVIVQKGDTLNLLAQQLRTSVDTLKSINHLKNNTIYPKQVLLYPATSHRKPIVYRVRRGDTLSKIAQRFAVSVSDIAQKNDIINHHVIHVGQQLVIH